MGKVDAKNETVVLLGDMEHKIDRSGADRGFIKVDLYAHLSFRNVHHRNARVRLLRLHISPGTIAGEIIVACSYGSLCQSQFLPMQKFRQYLEKCFETILQEENLSEVEKKGIEKYLREGLANFSESEVLYREIKEEIDRRKKIHDHKKGFQKLRQFQRFLGINSACDGEFVIESASE